MRTKWNWLQVSLAVASTLSGLGSIVLPNGTPLWLRIACVVLAALGSAWAHAIHSAPAAIEAAERKEP